jgi:hypothetical protein
VPRAVLVGTRIAPGQAETKPDGTVVRTMWGELAWQLGQQAGVDAFGLVADADRTSSNPGVALRRVFELVGPCLILVDEWVAYARQLRGDDAHVGGTFDTHFSFAQALTEAVGDVPGVLLVVSIPASISDDEDEAASELEIGGRDGYVALQQLRNVIGRRGMSWRPASVEESFEIVRRRLFKPLDGDALQRRDITARAFFDFYSRHSSEFPPACKDKPYLERLKRAYPIHPELFDRLYDDWSTLERFQRTRGVLRLMASVIHALWTANDQSPLILPGNLPLDVASVATELTNKLDDTWKPILDADIDGEHALATELDRLSNDIGKHSAARRVARTVFLGSAPLVRSSRRGMETARIRLGCAMPGDKLSVFSDALNRLADRSTYLNVEAGNRYWYSVNPTLARMARERAERFATDERHVVEAEIVARLEQEKQPGRRGAFAAVHVAPDSSAEVADEPEARLVILGPRQPHAAKGPSAAAQTALDVVLYRGGAQREFRNALVFLAPDSRRIGELEAAVADYLAWRSIRDDAGILNLDDSQKQQVAVRFESADNTVVGRLRETYTQVLVPEQPEPTGPITLHTVTVSRPEQLAADVSKKLVAEGMLHTAFAYESLRALHLDGPLAAVWEQGHVSVRELYGYMARYPYLRRLADLGVLTATVAAGTATTDWEQRAFAVASAVTADGRYLDLTAGAHPNGLDATWLVVRPDRARAQLDQMAAARATVATSADVDLGTTVVDLDGASADTPSAPTRFRARIPVDRERPQRAVDGIVADIVAHLNKPGTDLSITVVIEAHRADGFDDGVQRTLAENASVMKAQLAEFE